MTTNTDYQDLINEFDRIPPAPQPRMQNRRRPQQEGEDRYNFPREFTEEHRNGLANYNSSAAALKFLTYQLENQHEWERQRIQESQENSSDPFDTTFFHFHHNANQMNTRYNFDTWDNNDSTEGMYPPAMRRLQNEMDEIEENAPNHNEWLSNAGLRENHPLLDEMDEEQYENMGDMERFDGGYGIWREDYGRDRRLHPNADFMVEELIEQGRLQRNEEGDIEAVEGEEDTYERYMSDESISGYRTSEEIMRRYIEEMRNESEVMNEEKTRWLEQFRVEGLVGLPAVTDKHIVFMD